MGVVQLPLTGTTKQVALSRQKGLPEDTQFQDALTAWVRIPFLYPGNPREVKVLTSRRDLCPHTTE